MIVQGSPLTIIHYNKRLNDFVRKKYVKATVIADDKSRVIVSFDVHFEEVHDSNETLENMGSEVIDKFRIVIDDNGCDSERIKSRYC